MAETVFVGNIASTTTESSLNALFTTRGFSVTRVFIPMNRMSGRPRGFAFVNLADRRQAESALQELDGAELDGQLLVLQAAMSSEPERAPAPVVEYRRRSTGK